MQSFLSAIFSCFFLLTAFSQQPDSVQVKGSWFYVYPIPEKVDPSIIQQLKMDLITEEFDLFRSWKKTNDPRAKLRGRKLHRAMKKELIDSKRMGEWNYRDERKDLHSNKYLRSVISFEGPGHPWIMKPKVKKRPALLIKQEIDINYDLVPYVGDLPDGRYIQYFEDFYSYNKVRKTKKLPPRMACVFELKDNRLNGNYERYSYFGDTLRSGRFNLGQRDGNWLITQKNQQWERAKRQSWFGNSNHIYALAGFDNGQLNGHYELWNNGILNVSGNYDHGWMTGDWIDAYPIDITLRFDLPAKDSTVCDNSPAAKQELLRLNLWEHETRKRAPSESSFSIANNYYLGGEYILNLRLMDKYVQSFESLEQLFINLPFATRQNEVLLKKDSLMFYAFQTYLDGDYGFGEGTPAFRYRYDPEINAILGSHYYTNGRLCDTIGYDAVNQQFFRKVFTEKYGKLYFEKRWDSKGVVLSEKEYSIPRPNVLTIEGFPVSTHVGKKATIYTWNNTTDSVIGNRKYESIQWTSTTGPRYSEVYANIETREIITTEYNNFGEVAFYSTEKTDTNTIDSDELWFTNYTEWVAWGDLKLNYAWSSAGGDNELMPVLSFDTIPYNGELIYRRTKHKMEYTRKAPDKLLIETTPVSKVRGHKDQRNQLAGLPQQTLNLGTWNDAFELLFGYVDLDPVKEIEGELVNGKPFGSWKFYGQKHRLLYELNYNAEGQPGGNYHFYTTAQKSNRWYRKRNKHNPNIAQYRPAIKRKTHYERLSYTLKNGKVNGTWIMRNAIGDTIELRNYDNGKLHGKQFLWNDNAFVTINYDQGIRAGDWTIVEYKLQNTPYGGKVSFDTTLFAQYENGLLNGRTLIVNKEDVTAYTGFYRNGKLNGTVTVVNLENKELTAKLVFADGFLLKKEEYHKGTVSCSYECPKSDSALLKNSILDGKLQLVGISGTQFSNEEYKSYYHYATDDLLDVPPTAYFTKFDPMGQPARRGQLTDKTKTGRWEFFAYGGKPIYTIDYKDTVLEINGHRTRVLGIYTELDSSGNTISRRAVTEEIENYNCSHDEYYAVREYLTIEDPADQLERTNGLAKNYFDNGMLMSEGQLKNGSPEGVWKFYTPDGKLNRIGRYEDGQKQGRWLSGDLSDKKYIGDLCLDPDDPQLDLHVAQMERELDIDVESYKNGFLQAKQSYTIEK